MNNKIFSIILAFFSTTAFGGIAHPQCSDSDVQCIGEKSILSAAIYCRNHIESLADSDWKWDEGTDSGFWAGATGGSGIFSKFKWTHGASVPTTLTFFGDKAKSQNASGAFMRIIYSCEFNVKTKDVYRVKLNGYGRL